MGFDRILRYAMKRIHFKARQVLGKRGFTENDFDDLRQDLMADLVKRLPKFNGRRAGMKTFVCRLIDNRIASLIEHREADCRDYRRDECSLDENGTHRTIWGGEPDANPYGEQSPADHPAPQPARPRMLPLRLQALPRHLHLPAVGRSACSAKGMPTLRQASHNR